MVAVGSASRVLILALIAVFEVLMFGAAFAWNGQQVPQERKAMYPSGTEYSIWKTYALYYSPPQLGQPGYDAWPVKTDLYEIAVPYMKLLAADFTA